MTGFSRFSVFPRLVAAGALTIYFLAAALGGRAQTTFGSITGNVTDANGAIVAGATIEATHVRSNYRYTARSNEVGNFTLPQLREGEYTLRANATGFREFVAQIGDLVGPDAAIEIDGMPIESERQPVSS